MRYLYSFLLLLIFSCNNKRELQLPEIQNAEVTEILDVSPAYIFLDETQPDSTLFNRKNLISTTNWLVNVDKRLTLKQAIPHIQYLQNKRKKASMHKNENAKNYFTCNDTSIKNLGFLEFTDVDYANRNKDQFFDDDMIVYLFVDNSNLVLSTSYDTETELNYSTFENYFKEYNINDELIMSRIGLVFDKSTKFQNYITVKSKLMQLTPKHIILDRIEYVD